MTRHVGALLLGGVVGLGTVLYAVAIGPLVQVFLPLFTVRLDVPSAVASGSASEDPSGEVLPARDEAVDGEPLEAHGLLDHHRLQRRQ